MRWIKASELKPGMIILTPCDWGEVDRVVECVNHMEVKMVDGNVLYPSSNLNVKVHDPERTHLRPMRGGGYCTMDKDHKGRCSSVTFQCEGCGKTRRGRPEATHQVKLGDGTVDDSFDFCFMCVVVESRTGL